MIEEGTCRVFDALEADGGQARFVGGCVRDALLGRPVLDIDIATPLTPDEVIERLDAAGIKHVPTGIKHGTITAVVDGAPFEITTLRRDVETDGRHAKVTFTRSWREDAERRDFTMNALYATREGEIFDPFGGIADVRQGVARFIGEPQDRIKEDVLRILRFFRFYARYGAGEPDSAGLAACRDMAGGLKKLSAERIRNEILKILGSEDPAHVWRVMLDNGILAPILPELTDIDTLSAISGAEVSCEHVDEGYVTGDPIRRLVSVMTTRTPDAVDSLADRLRLSNDQRARMQAMLALHDEIDFSMNHDTAHRMIYRYGKPAFMDALLLAGAEQGIGGGDDLLKRLFTLSRRFTPPDFPLRGQDALVLGMEPGPELGAVLKAVEDWWVEKNFKPDRAACFEELKRRIGDMQMSAS